ncbi:MAG TPA: TMEM165/GDT1 family protein, partial [Burkholderiales bacterium]|nr:TMEM165/GDT1 family protein [Burkholderiales bacterium]
MAASFLVPTVVVALAEIGDKTQLLSLLLAARFRKPVPIIIGILLATLLNHSLAGMLGEWLRSLVSADAARWVLGVSLIAIAAWVLRPDEIGNVESTTGRWGVFVIALVSFFFAEIGDKTQIATIVMAAQYHDLVSVVLGTTLG